MLFLKGYWDNINQTRRVTLTISQRERERERHREIILLALLSKRNSLWNFIKKTWVKNMIQGWLLCVISKVTTELFIIFSDYWSHLLKWGIRQDICDGYDWHYIVFLIFFTGHILNFVIESGSSARKTNVNKVWNNNRPVYVNERNNQNKNKTKSRHIQTDHVLYCLI